MGRPPAAKPKRNGGFGSVSGPSRGDSRRGAIRPIEASKAVIRDGRFTSTPVLAVGDLAPLTEKNAFDAALAPLRGSEWVVHDLEIPIGCAPPNSVLPPRGFLLARLSNAGPDLAPPSRPQGPASETFTKAGEMALRDDPKLRRFE